MELTSIFCCCLCRSVQMEVGDKGSVKTSSRSGVTDQKVEEKGTPL